MNAELPQSEVSQTGDTPEERRERAMHIINFLHKSGMLEDMNSERKKTEFLKSLTPESAVVLLERLQGVLIGTPINDRAIFTDMGTVRNPDTNEALYVPPSPSNQYACIEKIILPTLQKVSLVEASEIAATEINLLHMFSDGNGRLGRLAYLLLNPNFKIDDSEECIATMVEYLSDRKKSLNYDPSLIEEEIRNVIAAHGDYGKEFFQITDIVNLPNSKYGPDDDVTGASPNEMATACLASMMRGDKFDAIVGVREYLFRTQKKPSAFLVSNGPDTNAVDLTKFLETIQTKEQLTLFLGCRDIPKIKRIQIVADMYMSPNRYPSPMPGMNLKNYFRKRVQETAQ
jgi:hypothetical protein